MPDPIVLLAALLEALQSGLTAGLRAAVETATGPAGLLIIGVYSFLIAIVLPLPSEVVLLAPLNLGLPEWTEFLLIILASAVGKAAGSVLALKLGNEAKEYGPLLRALKQSRFDIVSWSERRTVEIARQYGYIGLAVALSIPFFPDTISIYAFTVLEDHYVRFALATFAGSVGRLLVWVSAGEAVTAVLPMVT